MHLILAHTRTHASHAAAREATHRSDTPQFTSRASQLRRSSHPVSLPRTPPRLLTPQYECSASPDALGFPFFALFYCLLIWPLFTALTCFPVPASNLTHVVERAASLLGHMSSTTLLVLRSNSAHLSRRRFPVAPKRRSRH